MADLEQTYPLYFVSARSCLLLSMFDGVVLLRLKSYLIRSKAEDLRQGHDNTIKWCLALGCHRQ